MFRRRKFSFAECFSKTLTDAIVIDRPDIGASEIEKEKHLDRPAADPAHSCQTRDDFLIAHPKKRATGWDRSIQCFRSKVLYRRDLCARKTSGAKRFVRCGQNFCGIEPFSFGIKRADAVPNAGRRFSVQL